MSSGLPQSAARRGIEELEVPLGFRWLGAAGLELRINGQVLLIDPYFTRIRFWQQWMGPIHSNSKLCQEKVPRCDWVLVTHAHWDHLMDVPEVLKNTGAVAYGSPNTCQLLAVLGVPPRQVREIGVGDRLTLGSLNVEVIAAEHQKALGFTPGPLRSRLAPPLWARDYRMDSCFCFLIIAGRQRLLTDPGEHSDRAVPANVLFVSPHRERSYYESLLGRVRPTLVIPNHWDDIWRPLSQSLRPMLAPPTWAWPPMRRINLAQFRQTVEQLVPGTQVFVPEIFKVHDLQEVELILDGTRTLR